MTRKFPSSLPLSLRLSIVSVTNVFYPPVTKPPFTPSIPCPPSSLPPSSSRLATCTYPSLRSHLTHGGSSSTPSGSTSGQCVGISCVCTALDRRGSANGWRGWSPRRAYGSGCKTMRQMARLEWTSGHSGSRIGHRQENEVQGMTQQQPATPGICTSNTLHNVEALHDAHIRTLQHASSLASSSAQASHRMAPATLAYSA